VFTNSINKLNYFYSHRSCSKKKRDRAAGASLESRQLERRRTYERFDESPKSSSNFPHCGDCRKRGVSGGGQWYNGTGGVRTTLITGTADNDTRKRNSLSLAPPMFAFLIGSKDSPTSPIPFAFLHFLLCSWLCSYLIHQIIIRR